MRTPPCFESTALSEDSHPPSRRTFLKAAGLAAFTGLTTGVNLAQYPFGPAEVFDFGVSSSFGFEPWQSVHLCARVDAGRYIGDTRARWYVYHDPYGNEPVRHPSAHGDVRVSPLNDYQVRTSIEGLEPDRHYYYRFELTVDGHVEASSGIARTKTAPAPDRVNAPMRFAVLSCQNYSHGYFHAHDAIANDDSLDFVVHLGDYVYADVDDRLAAILLGYPRTDYTPTATDLGGYRRKYQMYRSDEMLRRAHAAHPWIAIWDDHEITNNYERGLVPAHRVNAARQAWWEAMPMPRFPKYPDQIWRGIPWGRDIQIALMDARTYRQGDDIWGEPQRSWFSRPNERQTVLFNSTLIPRSMDLTGIVQDGIVVTGDNHVQGATTLERDGEAIGLEIMCGAATSRSGDPDLSNRMEYVSRRTRGYTVVEVHPEEGVEVTFVNGDVERMHPSVRMEPRTVLEATWGKWALRDVSRVHGIAPATTLERGGR